MLLGVHFPIRAGVTGPCGTKERSCDRHKLLYAFAACGSCLHGALPIQAEAIAGGVGFCGTENVSSLREDHTALRSCLPGMWRSAANLSDAAETNIRILVSDPRQECCLGGRE